MIPTPLRDHNRRQVMEIYWTVEELTLSPVVTFPGIVINVEFPISLKLMMEN
jgi:hypothetical protein